MRAADHVVTTDRLRLRPFRAGDLDAVVAIQTREDNARYLYRDPMTADEAAAWLAATLQYGFAREGDRLRLAVTVPPGDVVVGYAQLHLSSALARQAELGYAIHPGHAGRGYATEAARELIRLGFETYGMHRVFARIDAGNVASVRVCERLGMRKEAHFIENDVWNGRFGDEVVYAMLAREWDGVGRSG
ncbi:MAG: GNAT family N-acetyltransferase [Thermoleophilia bacterium]|nr:GNAT family N-acetyltransferase [Thermoleophilia bacterium]